MLITNFTRRPTGVVGRGADCYTEGNGFESQVSHGCKTVRSFIEGNSDPPLRCLHNKMVTTSGLSGSQKP